MIDDKIKDIYNAIKCEEILWVTDLKPINKAVPFTKNAAVVNCKICHIPNSLNSSREKSKNFSNAFAPLKKLSEWKLPTTTAQGSGGFLYGQKGQNHFGCVSVWRHHVVGIDSCQTEDVIADKIIVAVRKLLPSFRRTTYNEDTGKGFLRHILVKRGFATNQIMLVLVTGTPVFPSKNNFVKAILKQFPEITNHCAKYKPLSHQPCTRWQSESAVRQGLYWGYSLRLQVQNFAEKLLPN